LDTVQNGAGLFPLGTPRERPTHVISPGKSPPGSLQKQALDRFDGRGRNLALQSDPLQALVSTHVLFCRLSSSTKKSRKFAEKSDGYDTWLRDVAKKICTPHKFLTVAAPNDEPAGSLCVATNHPWGHGSHFGITQRSIFERPQPGEPITPVPGVLTRNEVGILHLLSGNFLKFFIDDDSSQSAV